MREIFTPGTINGEIKVPASKSQSHRAMICAALAAGSRITGLSRSEDMTATLGALKALGAELEVGFDPSSGMTLTTRSALSASSKLAPCKVDCGESASTLRFMIPIAAALGREVEFVGHGRLPKRTTLLYKPLLEAHGVKMLYPDNGDFLPLKQSGKLTGGELSIRGDISSQFVTGLLFALAMLGDGKIHLTTRLESRPYADLTVDMLKSFGILIDETENDYRILGGSFKPIEFSVDGDCSQAAFFAVAAAINGRVHITGIDPNTRQGDFAVFDILKRFGASVSITEKYISVEHSSLNASDIDAANIPDLVPALAVLAAYAEGQTRIYNAGRLRLKESDRIASTAELIRSLGGEAHETEDGLVICGRQRLSGGFAEACGDHRIAMAAAAASVGCIGEVVVDDVSCTAKSYPDFCRDWNSLLCR